MFTSTKSSAFFPLAGLVPTGCFLRSVCPRLAQHHPSKIKRTPTIDMAVRNLFKKFQKSKNTRPPAQIHHFKFQLPNPCRVFIMRVTAVCERTAMYFGV